MRHTVTGLVEKPVDAQRIIEELMARCLADRADIALISHDPAGQPSRVVAGASRVAGQVAIAAGTAAAHTFAGLMEFASTVSRQMPGAGAFHAMGQLGAKLSRTALHTAEELGKAFVDFGLEQELARKHAEALRAGSILIVVDAKTDAMAQCARQIFSSHGAVMPEVRATH
jgi:hypothetical protein